MTQLCDDLLLAQHAVSVATERNAELAEQRAETLRFLRSVAPGDEMMQARLRELEAEYAALDAADQAEMDNMVSAFRHAVGEATHG